MDKQIAMPMFKIAALAFSIMAVFAANAQRISDKNSIGWYTTTLTYNINPRWGLHGEYQWRWEDFVTRWQQGLLRAGINYKPNTDLLLRAGWAWAQTYNYGDIPLQAAGKPFPEHRTFQMLQVNSKQGPAELNQRLMLEQRWVGVYSNPALAKTDSTVYTNRVRYMFRTQLPLKGKTLADKTAYAAVYDEILIGFGKNVNQNVFDQNRFGALLGYRFTKRFRVEGGFLSQMVQLGRRVNNQNVFQYNNGIIINTLVTLD